MKPATFFVIGNHEVKSREGITQGHPTAMGAYALGVNPLSHFISQFIYANEQISKEVAFPDNFTVPANCFLQSTLGYNYSNKGLCLASSSNHPSHI